MKIEDHRQNLMMSNEIVLEKGIEHFDMELFLKHKALTLLAFKDCLFVDQDNQYAFTPEGEKLLSFWVEFVRIGLDIYIENKVREILDNR